MSLSKPSPRQLVHTRLIACHGYQRQDGLWDIEATLEDTKAYSFANRDRDGIAAGEPIHRMRVRVSVDDAFTIRAAEATTEAGPFAICGDIAPAFSALIGLQIGDGWRRAVNARFTGVAGCTHLTELLLGPVATTALQTVVNARSQRQQPASDGGAPALIDSCHALRGDGPIVKREWPAFYRGKS